MKSPLETRTERIMQELAPLREKGGFVTAECIREVMCMMTINHGLLMHAISGDEPAEGGEIGGEN